MKLLSPLSLLAGVLLSFVSTLNAQNAAPCATDEVMQALKDQNPQIAEQIRQSDEILAEQATLQKKSGQGVVYTIPVVVHVIYNNMTNNISKEQIEDGLRVLNEDFRRLNADTNKTRNIFKPLAADVEIQFELAKKDPNGNCTDGITRTFSNLTVDARNNVKDLIAWNNSRYLNIWVVNNIGSNSGQGITLGYAYRPFFGQDYEHDGVLIRHDYLGSIGASDVMGRTLTHEVGHYLGLHHPFHSDPNQTWLDGCSSGQGDDIADTPPVMSASFGCNTTRNSCHNDSPDRPDMVENYMDYADDGCTNMFTTGQKNYMRTVLSTFSHRGNLITTANHAMTGLANTSVCKPIAKINTSRSSACPDDAISFSNNSINFDSLSASYKWHFPGGTPAISTDENPSVSYPDSGFYDVSFVVTNAMGTDSIFFEDYVKVKSYHSSYNAQWIEDFETELEFPEVGVTSEGDEVVFQTTNMVSSSGSKSLYLENFNSIGKVDEFISPNIFTDHAEGLSLSFDYAFAGRTYTNKDSLRILASNDCGKTWTPLKHFSSVLLRTKLSNVTIPFIPTASDWKTETIDLSQFEDNGPLVVKFEFTNGGGNNLYIDNINLSATNVSLSEEDLAAQMQIFPNPASEAFSISFDGATADMQVTITDLFGKTVRTLQYRGGDEKIEVERGNMASGVYLVRLSDGENTYTKKLVIQ